MTAASREPILVDSADHLHGKPCPKRGHVRTAADTNPAWQYPKCFIVYLKHRPASSQLAARLVAGGREMAAEARADHSVWVLIAANLAALLIAYQTDMSLRELMLVYWIQSVIIGRSLTSGSSAMARVMSCCNSRARGATASRTSGCRRWNSCSAWPRWCRARACI